MEIFAEYIQKKHLNFTFKQFILFTTLYLNLKFLSIQNSEGKLF